MRTRGVRARGLSGGDFESYVTLQRTVQSTHMPRFRVFRRMVTCGPAELPASMIRAAAHRGAGGVAMHQPLAAELQHTPHTANVE